ncbi:MAG: hypothetical protein R2741_00810 [Methanolobus sp.]
MLVSNEIERPVLVDIRIRKSKHGGESVNVLKAAKTITVPPPPVIINEEPEPPVSRPTPEPVRREVPPPVSAPEISQEPDMMVDVPVMEVPGTEEEFVPPPKDSLPVLHATSPGMRVAVSYSRNCSERTDN